MALYRASASAVESHEKTPVSVDVFQERIGTYTRGRNGRLKLLRYDLKALVKGGGIRSLLSKGTVFTVDRTTVHVLLRHFLIAVAAGAAVLIDADVTSDHISGLKDLSEYLGRFVPFVLGLYISLTLQRWWQLRQTALAPVHDAISNVCLMLAVFLPNKEECRDIRESVLKYGTACVDLVVQAARRNPDLDCFVRDKVLSAEEARIIQRYGPYQRAMMMWSWIGRVVFHAYEKYQVPWPVYRIALKESLSARNAIQTIHTYLMTQMPFAYVHLINVIVNIQNTINSVKCGMVIGITLRELVNGGDFALVWTVCCELASWFIVPVIYHGLLVISYVVQDPFGEDVLDFPILAYSHYVQQTCRTLLAARYCPAELKLFNHVSRVRGHDAASVGAMQYSSSSTDSAMLVDFAETRKTTVPAPEDSSNTSLGCPKNARSDGAPFLKIQPADDVGTEKNRTDSGLKFIIADSHRLSATIANGNVADKDEPALAAVVSSTLVAATELVKKFESKMPGLDAYMEYCGLPGFSEGSIKQAETAKRHAVYSSLPPALAHLAKLAHVLETTSKDSAVRLLEVVNEMEVNSARLEALESMNEKRRGNYTICPWK